MDISQETIHPDFEWYKSESIKNNVPPRCPFQAVKKCPIYYSSLSLLSTVGYSEIDPEEDERLEIIWKNTDLWPVMDELSPSISGSKKVHTKAYARCCPEGSYLVFELFACTVWNFVDKIDIIIYKYCLFLKVRAVNSVGRVSPF